MIPLLAQLGIALAAGVAQKMSADKEYDKNSKEHQQNIVTGIMDKRAARAGDSMYMQQALHGAKAAPKKPDMTEVLGPLASSVGMALLNRQERPSAAGVSGPMFSARPEDTARAVAADNSFNVSKGAKGWAGGGFIDDEDKYGNIA